MEVDAPRRVHRPRWLEWLAWLPFLALVVHHRGWFPDVTQGDYAQYLSHARAVVEGRAYDDIGYLYHAAAWSLGPTTYPPGLPLTLAPLLIHGDSGAVLARWLMLISLVAGAVLFARRVSRDCPAGHGMLAAAAAAYSIEASGRLFGPLSDPGFLALFWATILAADHIDGWTVRRTTAVTMLGGLAMAYRLPGLALVPALVLFAVWHRDRTRWRPLIPVALWVSGGAVALRLNVLSLPRGSSLASTLSTLPSRVTGALSALIDGTRELLQSPLPWAAGNLTYHALGMSLMLAGMAWVFRTWRRTLLGAAVASYLILLLAAPVSSARYYWPLWPLAMLALPIGLQALTSRYLPRLRGAAPLLMLAPFLSLPWLLTRAPRPSLQADPEGQALTMQIQRIASAGPTRVAFHNPRALTWLTRVPSMGLAERTAQGQLAAMMDREVTHLVLSSRLDGGCVEFIAAGLVRGHGDRFREAWANADYRVFEVLPGPLPDSGSWQPIDWRNPAAFCPGGRR